MTGRSEGEKFVDIFVDTIDVNMKYVATREDLRSGAHMARLATDSISVRGEVEEKQEEIRALTEKMALFKEQRIAELTGLVAERLAIVHDLSPSGMPSAILLADTQRRLDIVTGSDIKIMDNVSGFTGIAIPNDAEIATLANSPDTESEVLKGGPFLVDHMVYVNRANNENKLIPRVSVDIRNP